MLGVNNPLNLYSIGYGYSHEEVLVHICGSLFSFIRTVMQSFYMLFFFNTECTNKDRCPILWFIRLIFKCNIQSRNVSVQTSNRKSLKINIRSLVLVAMVNNVILYRAIFLFVIIKLHRVKPDTTDNFPVAPYFKVPTID